MLNIDSISTLYHAPPYANPIGRLSRTFRRYFVVSAFIATASLAVAVSISLLAATYAPNTQPTAEASAFPPFYAEVSSFNATGAATIVEGASLEARAETLESLNIDSARPLFEPPPDRLMINAKGPVSNVNITFYDCKKQGFCGAMYNGRKVYQGAAACSWNLALGTKFFIVGDPTRRVYVCEDRGLLSDTWVDIFWNDPRDGYMWAAFVGRHGTIEVVDLP